MKTWVLIGFAFGIAACGNVPREKFCKEYGVAMCANSCCDQVTATDASQCLAEWSTTCEASLVTALDAGYVTYDGQAAAACLDAVKARFATCPGKTNLTQFNKPASEACEKYLVGTVREGGNCDSGGTFSVRARHKLSLCQRQHW
ncbi:MAG: hypothetical protein K1X64_16330 [Myxococcaceae bacterium]|nr:hypothetical protein [Myxococcaceae bacterium]